MELQKEKIAILPELLDGIRSHARVEATKKAEAVGFLARQQGTTIITTNVRFNNHAPDRETGYFVEPAEQFRAESKLEEEGYEVAGVYHSHPNSEAAPSQADSALARPGELMLIYSVIFDEFRAWREDSGQLHEVVIADG